jgi:hypothetical protein
MAKQVALPKISPEELVESLGLLQEKVEHQDELIRQLKDEIALLKKHNQRPKIKPSKMDQETEAKRGGRKRGRKRPGSKKRRKTKALRIDEVIVVEPKEEVPDGSEFKGYNDYVVQGLVIAPYNIRYRLACWLTPQGHYVRGELPAGIQGWHYDPTLRNFVLYQYYHAHVTQPLLLEQLREWGVDISAGQLSRILTADKAGFHAEKDALLAAGLRCSTVVTVDDTTARHAGHNGYCTHIGNEFFAWFASTERKSRINFLELLRAGHTDYVLNDEAVAYMAEQKLPQGPLARLRHDTGARFADPDAWQGYLRREAITDPRHVRIATEGVLLGSILHHGLAQDLAIVSDDAGQFAVLIHGLCWVHAERTIHKLIPVTDAQRQAVASIRTRIWHLYRDLKKYQDDPTPARKTELEARFDDLFTTKTCYHTLNQALQRLHNNKAELLLVLDRPDVPLHTNGSERDIREYVKWRKISGGTRSEDGRRCRDTFASLKKTCRKLGISFWPYLLDRESRTHRIPALSTLIANRLACPP